MFESLNVPNFCLSHMSYVSLKFSCSCYSKYLNIAFTLCLVWCMLLELDFWPKNLGTKCPSHPKHLSHHFVKLVFERRKILVHFYNLTKSKMALWWTKSVFVTKCYATSFHAWEMGDIGKLVPFFDLIMIFLGVCMI